MTRQRSGDAGQLLATLPASVRQRNPQLPATTAPARRAPRKAPQRATAPVAALPAGAVVVDVPGLLLTSEANSRGHTKYGKADRTAKARAATAKALRGVALPPLPLRVCVTRIAPKALDSDNIHGSGAKAVRDEVADALGLPSDRDPRVTWRVAQACGPAGVRITLTPVDGRGRVETQDAADVVTMHITGTQWADAMRSMLDRAGGWARFDVPGLSLRLVLTRADL